MKLQLLLLQIIHVRARPDKIKAAGKLMRDLPSG